MVAASRWKLTARSSRARCSSAWRTGATPSASICPRLAEPCAGWPGHSHVETQFVSRSSPRCQCSRAAADVRRRAAGGSADVPGRAAAWHRPAARRVGRRGCGGRSRRDSARSGLRRSGMRRPSHCAAAHGRRSCGALRASARRRQRQQRRGAPAARARQRQRVGAAVAVAHRTRPAVAPAAGRAAPATAAHGRSSTASASTAQAASAQPGRGTCGAERIGQ